MKRMIGIVILMVGMVCAANSKGFDARFNMFYSSLSPYGDWVDVNYGYAWRPTHVAHHWRPYMYGRWEWTDYGWYWVSEEPFGWATFHYGRWVYDDYYGWIWVPDDVWGPSWVEWRYSDDYIGWAPLSPAATFSFGVGITYTDRWVAPMHYWNFVPCRNFASVRVVDYVQPIEQTRRIFGNTRGTVNIRTDNNRVVNGGVDVNFVERRANVRINRVDVVDNNRGNGDRIVRDRENQHIEVYRPHLDASPGDRGVRRQDVQQNNRPPDRVMPQRREFDRQQHNAPPEVPPDRGVRRQNDQQNNRPPDRVMPQRREFDRQQHNAPPEVPPDRQVDRHVQRPQREAPPQRFDAPRRNDNGNSGRGNMMDRQRERPQQNQQPHREANPHPRGQEQHGKERRP